MKSFIKKTLAVLLSATLLFSVVPLAAAAETTVQESVGASSGTTGECTWTLDDNGVLTIGVPTGLTGEKGDKGDKGNKGDKGDTGNGIASIAKTGTSGNVDTYTITMTDGTTTTFTVTNGNVTSVNGQSGAVNLSVSASESDGVVTLTI